MEIWNSITNELLTYSYSYILLLESENTPQDHAVGFLFFPRYALTESFSHINELCSCSWLNETTRQNFCWKKLAAEPRSSNILSRQTQNFCGETIPFFRPL